jgi:RNA polymerase sigma-70 factor (ECF subfamily)
MSVRHAPSLAGDSGQGAAPVSDAELLARLANGEIGALGELYDRHHEAIRRFLARATSDAEDVDDLLSATFLAAAKSAPRFDGRAACRPWLLGIAAQYLRRRRQSFGRWLKALSSLSRIQVTAFDPRSTLQARSDVERALRTLSEAQRVTFLMAEVEGLTCPEIADALRIPVGTVWTRLHAARRNLRATLEAGSDP